MDHVDKIKHQWNTERPDIDTNPMAVIGRVKRLTVLLEQRMDQIFLPYGLNRASFDVLATLRRSGAPYALSPSDLMDWTMVTSGTMTNRIDRLEETGLVKREKNPDDGRGFVIVLTQKGFNLINTVVEKHVNGLAASTSCLEEADIEQLNALLKVWTKHIEELS